MGSIVIVIVILIVVGVGYMFWKKQQRKKQQFKEDADIVNLIELMNWYYRNVVEGMDLSTTPKNTMDNLGYFFTLVYPTLGTSAKINVQRALYVYDEQLQTYIKQIQQEVKGLTDSKDDTWYTIQSEHFAVLYQSVLQAVYQNIIASHAAEFAALDFETYQVAQNEIEHWKITDDFETNEKVLK